jgi:hypothetical protein
MRRADLIEATAELKSALIETKISEFLGNLEKKRDEGPSSEVRILAALKDYAIRAHLFEPATRHLAKIFDLEPLERAEQWLMFLDASPPAALMRNRIRFALEFLPAVVEMLEPELLRRLKQESEAASPYRGMRVLSVTVFEPEKLLSSPLRLANVLESINHFYTACALMENESPSTLSVVACDSGSDKSFDFLGIAKVMDCIERLIGTIWDRAFFFRERQFEERLELVAKSLPIIEHIGSMLEQKQVDPAMAELLKRNIFDGSNKFLQSGATIPKIEDTSQYNPRLLLSPVQKLLVAAPDEVLGEVDDVSETDVADNKRPREEAADAGKLDLGNLSSHDQEELIRLVEKSKRKKQETGNSDIVDQVSEDSDQDDSENA